MKRVKSWIEGCGVAVTQLLMLCILFVGLPPPLAEASGQYELYREPNCEGSAMLLAGHDLAHAMEHGAVSARDRDTGQCNRLERNGFWATSACLAGVGFVAGALTGAAAAAVGVAIVGTGGTAAVGIVIGAGALGGAVGGVVGTYYTRLAGIECHVRVVPT